MVLNLFKKKAKMYQNHILMVYFCIEKFCGLLYYGIIRYYDVKAHMKKQYEEMVL